MQGKNWVPPKQGDRESLAAFRERWEDDSRFATHLTKEELFMQFVQKIHAPFQSICAIRMSRNKDPRTLRCIQTTDDDSLWREMQAKEATLVNRRDGLALWGITPNKGGLAAYDPTTRSDRPAEHKRGREERSATAKESSKTTVGGEPKFAGKCDWCGKDGHKVLMCRGKRIGHPPASGTKCARRGDKAQPKEVGAVA